MSTIRTTLLSVFLTFVVALAVYFAAAPLPVRAAQRGTSCPAMSAASLSTEELRALLNARYLHRVGLPR